LILFASWPKEAGDRGRLIQDILGVIQWELRGEFLVIRCIPLDPFGKCGSGAESCIRAEVDANKIESLKTGKE
jgi:hypothetical protein